MIVRYMPADPTGNLTAIVLSPVAPQAGREEENRTVKAKTAKQRISVRRFICVKEKFSRVQQNASFPSSIQVKHKGNRKSRSADAPGEESEGFPLTEPMRAWTAETLIDAYGDELLRLCLLYLGDRQLAEDAFQETMVKAWRALPGFRGESGAKTWLFHIAVNTCRDMLRSGWMRMRRRSVPLEVMPELAGQEDERLREMTAAVLALPDKYRETVVLFYYKQMKIREIAEALHIPQNSVSSRLRRARAMLQIDMEGGKDA